MHLGQDRGGPVEPEPLDQLFPELYAELRRAAARLLAGERVGHTLQPTALVHEAWLKLEGAPVAWRDKAHFVGMAARAMRQVLVDHARRRLAAKRGGGGVELSLAGVAAPDADRDEMLGLDAALDRLEQVNPRWRQVVEWRFFAGLTEAEIARLLGVTERTAQRDWAHARAWLYRELYQ
jgi:RNA polymerase sigma factor (TIGR02999 family)